MRSTFVTEAKNQGAAAEPPERADSSRPAQGRTPRMSGYRPIAPGDFASEADLMRRVADGSEEAIAVLYRRFAPLIIGLAVQTLDHATGEDLLQEVFLALWRNAARFDPERGTLGAWVRQIARFRILNELRRQSRQPAIVPDPEGLVLDGLPADDPEPAEAAWQGHCHA